MAKQAGKIKFYNTSKGFGFITPDDGSADVFLHSTVCEKCRFVPEQGAAVSFDDEVSQKGRKATWVG
jgi:CspA family cold shock protein